MANQPPVGFPPPNDHDTHQRGLDELADIAGEARAPFVPAPGPVDYCLVHYMLVPDPIQRVDAQGAVPRRNHHAFEQRLHDTLTRLGGHPLHKYVYACPFIAEDGLSSARAIWGHLGVAGHVPNPRPGQQVPDDWRLGDALYVHYPCDDGMTFTGAVIDADGVPLPAW